jgi:hypothetical protein
VQDGEAGLPRKQGALRLLDRLPAPGRCRKQRRSGVTAAREKLAWEVAQVAALYLRLPGAADLDLDSPGWRARDRALDEAFASGDERAALLAVEEWKNGAVAELECGPGIGLREGEGQA